MKKGIFLLLISGQVFNGFAQNITITGKVFDEKSKQVLPFVNIGIYGKNIGTVSDENGEFTIDIPKQNRQDTLVFYALGFEYKKNAIIELEKQQDGKLIYLKSKSFQLKEVVISAKERKEKILGIASLSGDVRLDIDSYKPGTQLAYLMKFKKDAIIKSVGIHIAQNHLSQFALRVRVYDIDKNTDLPGEDLLKQNVIDTIKIKSGWVMFDLTKYNVTTEGSFFVAFEWLDRDLKYDEDFEKSHSSEENKSPIWISGKLELLGKNNSCFLSTSQSKWESSPISIMESAIQATVIY